MSKIYSPNKDYNGVSAGITFVNGVGETDIPHLITWFMESGYTVEKFNNFANNDKNQTIKKKPSKKEG
jgi:hypothetical protein